MNLVEENRNGGGGRTAVAELIEEVAERRTRYRVRKRSGWREKKGEGSKF